MKKTIVIAALASACQSAPATPTWQADVLPVVASNCVRCHGAVPAYGAPRSFRLDVLEDATIDPLTGMPIHGAQTMYYRIRDRVNDESMPPKLPLVGDSVDVIANWAGLAVDGNAVANSYTTPPPRGDGRAGNHAPTIALTPTGAALEYAYAIDDADHDLVEGRLTVGGAVVASGMRAGHGSVTLDLGHVTTPGAQPLVAQLDDGAAITTTDVGTVDVPDARVSILSPAPTDLLLTSDKPPIELCADRPGTTATVSAIASNGDRVTIATAVAIGPCTGSTAVASQPLMDAAPAGVSTWRLEVAIDTTSIKVTSPIFRISRGDKGPAFATVKQIVGDKCGSLCHHTCGAYPATLPYDFTVFKAADLSSAHCGDFVGIGERNRSLGGFNPGWVYERVIVRQDMPPAWAPPLEGTERQTIQAWLEGGAQP